MGLEVPDDDDRPGEVLLHESLRDLDLGDHVVDGLDLSFLDEDDRVHDLWDHPEFDPADEPLEGVDGSGRVNDADHAHPGQPHVREDTEIVGLSDLVVDGVIGPNHQKRVGRLLHGARELGVLGDLRADLEVARFLHRLHDVAGVLEELGDGLGERRLPGARRTGDEHAPVPFEQPALELLDVLVVLHRRFDDGPDRSDLDAVREGGLRDGDAHVPDLGDDHALLAQLDESVVAALPGVDYLRGELLQQIGLEWVVADPLIRHVTDLATLCHRDDAHLEVDGHGRLVEVVLDAESSPLALLGFEVLDRESLPFPDLRLDDIARDERGAVVDGDLANDRIDGPLARALDLALRGPPPDVLDLDLAVVVELGEALELLDAVPPDVAAAVGLCLDLADDGLGEVDGGPGVLPLGHLLRDAAVDDHARVRNDLHTC